jgi:hypothetical protein
MFTLNDFHAGDRVELHPACDMWMRGARFGTVAKVGRKLLTVDIDMLGRKVRVSPENIGKIWRNGLREHPTSI